MVKKCNKNEHSWRDLTLRWNARAGRIWVRRCQKCGREEKSKDAPELVGQVPKYPY